MQKSEKSIQLTMHEKKSLSLPAVVVGIFIGLLYILNSFSPELSQAYREVNLGIGIVGILYTILAFNLLLPLFGKFPFLIWVLAITDGCLLGAIIVTEGLLIRGVTLPLAIGFIITSALLTYRWPTYLLVFIAVAIQHTVFFRGFSFDGSDLLQRMLLPILAVIITETLVRLQETIYRHLHRMEILNSVGRSLATSLNIQQVVALISSAIQGALYADSYFVGLYRNGVIHLEVICDEGQFFPSADIEIEDSFTGWVIANRKPLFMQDVQKEGGAYRKKVAMLGSQHHNRSWMGVPLEANGQVLGIVVVASYKVRAFSLTDLDLLQNIALQSALALENANRHTQVEIQSQTDSLTGCLNHGAFLQALAAASHAAVSAGTQLCLLMLDIDHFKQYNDTYGHLVGDQVLAGLVQTIQSHVMRTDLVGRWGGEEFAVALLNTTPEQALKIAQRIQQSLSTFKLIDRDLKPISAPTISLGIAVYPSEAQEIYALVDVADQRLYIAKDRGRDQIEPVPSAASEAIAD